MRKKILVFGDSIAYGDYDKEGGWVIRLRKFLDERQLDSYETYNLGIPIDETTEKELGLLEFQLVMIIAKFTNLIEKWLLKVLKNNNSILTVC
jgi:hypothetical protein